MTASTPPRTAPPGPAGLRRGKSRYDTVTLKPAAEVEDFSEWRGVWVIVEQREGQVRDVTFELLGAGRPMADKLGVPLTAVLLCADAGDMPQQLASHGADQVIVVEHAWLSTPLARPSADVMTQLIKDRRPEVVLIGATHTGRDISSRIAVTVEAGMTADCTELDVEPDSRELLARRPAFGGKMLATIRCDRHRPQMATARPGIFTVPEPDAKAKAKVEAVTMDWLDERDYAAEVLDYVVDDAVDITKEDVLVAGGLGVGPDGWDRLAELANALGGEVACTRPVADAGWQERGRQVGQTGVSVRPKLYIAVGISGAIQHIEGMKESGTVIAINSDPNAGIFQYADIGLVGDWKGHVDALTKEAKARGLAEVGWKFPQKDTLADDRKAAADRASKKAGGDAKPAGKKAHASNGATPKAADDAGTTPPADRDGKSRPQATPAAAAEAAEAESEASAAPEAKAAPEAEEERGAEAAPEAAPGPTPEAAPAPDGVPEFTGDPQDREAVQAWVKENVPEEQKAWVLAADCIVCNGCEAACPTGAAVVDDIARVDRDICIADGGCFDACPTDAIRPGIEDEAQTAGWPEGSRLAGEIGT